MLCLLTLEENDGLTGLDPSGTRIHRPLQGINLELRRSVAV
jgi:hypothetical protein